MENLRKLFLSKVIHWTKIILLAYLTIGLFVPSQSAWADDSPTIQAADQTTSRSEEKASFFMQVVQNIFNSEGLMHVLSQPEYKYAAYITQITIIFTETGLLVGFFLPGDSLLVTVGLICSNPTCEWNLPFLMGALSLAAIIGDSVGYSIGFKAGPRLFNREDSLFFHKNHLLKAQQFYEKHGGKTIILARFMPILRTFAPVVAGIGKMDYRRFLFYNIFGGIGWVVGLLLVGYLLPQALNPVLQPIFGAEFLVQKHVEKVIVIVVLLSISPGIYVWLKNWFRKKPQSTPPQPESPDVAVAEAQ